MLHGFAALPHSAQLDALLACWLDVPFRYCDITFYTKKPCVALQFCNILVLFARCLASAFGSAQH